MNNQGKIIVIEGTDGSGKETQSKLLIEKLKQGEAEVDYFDFPRYGNPSAEKVERYLRGEFGSASEIDPYTASDFYSLDRKAAAPDMKLAKEKGRIVICNRFTSANMGHQAGKIKDLKEREKYLEWLEHHEFEEYGIPRPDLVILLFVPFKIAQELVHHKASRDYLRGKKIDIHEKDDNHLRDAEEAYLYVAKKYGWPVIDCTDGGKILSREEIHEKIYDVVKSIL